MVKQHDAEETFLQMGFYPPDKNKKGLQAIELIGIPGEKNSVGAFVVSEKTERFFDDLIVRKLFRQSQILNNCDFKYLKIWLYDADINETDRVYQVPKIDENDLQINSNIYGSKLDRIYVLDNELKGEKYEKWKKTAEKLFIPLFQHFISPPDPPSLLTDSIFHPLVRLAETITDSIDQYGVLKRHLFFNALIIQID